MKTQFLSILILLLSSLTYSQKPYFQQKVDYKIKTQLFPAQNKIESYETITYHNNSPDTLTYIYFHIWPNAYKNRHTALAKQLANLGRGQLYFHAKKVGGYIDKLDFKSAGKKLKWKYTKKNIDICIVYLPKALVPGDSIKISTPFEVFLPKDLSRMGHRDSAYQITQWYPKPAVYDRYGWHAFPYLDQGEFYSEYGNFNVEITVPKQQVVGATGNLLNKQEIKWLKKLAKEQKMGKELKNPAKGKTKTLRYTEKNIHDFAWFCSNKYYVDIDSIKTPRTKHLVHTWALFKGNDVRQWKNVTKYINNAIKYYSKWVGDYPYNNCTAVDGALSAGGGMEYPTITVISEKSGLESVVVHEVGHNWFYGMLGFNERRYPFLDEGINSYYDHRYTYDIKKQTPYFDLNPIINKNNLETNGRGIMQLSYSVPALFSLDQPLDLTSTDYSKLNYGDIVYEKTAQALEYLSAYLGQSTFDSLMQKFFKKWQYKHPYPIDLQTFFEKNSPKNISWFFNGYVKTNGKVDYALNYRHNKLIIKNKGDFAAPIKIVSYNNKIAVDTFWLPPIKNKIKIEKNKNKYTNFIIDPDFQTLDYYRYNNYVKTHGIFKRNRKIKFSLNSPFVDYYDRTTTVIPLIFYNKISKFQILSIITNIKFPPKKFNYYLMPIYSFGYKQAEGSAFFTYIKPTYNGFPGINYSFYIDRYPSISANSDIIPYLFRKMRFGIAFNLKNRFGNDKFNKNLKLSLSFIDKSSFLFQNHTGLAKFYVSIISLGYSMANKSKLHPFNFKFNLDIFGDTYQMTSEAKFKIHYFSLKDGLQIRVFNGFNVPVAGMYGLSDYQFSHFFWNRYNASTGKYPHQFIDNYGGLTFYYPNHVYFMVNALNLKTTIPKLPNFIKIYYNLVSPANFINGKGINEFDFKSPLFETGLMLDIIPNIFAIYYPVYGSQTLMDSDKAINTGKFPHFRFTFELENLPQILNSL